MTDPEGNYEDLLDRLQRAERGLVNLADVAPDLDERARLIAKASGVALATSYVREALKARTEAS